MKYTIEGFNQVKAIEYGLDVEDLIILRWIVDFFPKMTQQIIGGETYRWINYKYLLEDMPILKFKSKDRLYRKLKMMEEKGILKHKGIRNSDGSFSYYAFGENYINLLGKNNEPYVENNVGGTLKTTEQNNPSTKEINNICPSKDEQDSSLLLKELSDNFDKIWEIYPRKEGKNDAFNHYKAWLRGKEYAGKKIKLTNRQMWFAVKEYADLMKKNRTERQFIKMGSTFFNGTIMEYVKENNE